MEGTLDDRIVVVGTDGDDAPTLIVMLGWSALGFFEKDFFAAYRKSVTG